MNRKHVETIDGYTPILQLRVDAVFVKGTADPDLVERCCSNAIVVFHGMSYKALQAVSVMYQAPILSYVTDAIDVSVLGLQKCFISNVATLYIYNHDICFGRMTSLGVCSFKI